MKRFSLFLTTSVLSCLAFTPLANAQEHSHPANDEKPWSMADEYFDPEEMAHTRAHVLHHNGGQSFGMLMVDRLEVQSGEDEDVGVWDASYRYGGDIDKLYITTEGEYSLEHDEFEEVEVQALWSHAVSRFFDVQTGVRYDFEPDGLAHAVFGFQGLAPYWFEVDGAAYLSEKGDVTADFEAEYELLLTQRLILQPRLEIGISAQDIPELEVASGITDIEAGLRLRYEFKREIAPYIGIEHKALIGETANLAEAHGEEANSTFFVLGVRGWF